MARSLAIQGAVVDGGFVCVLGGHPCHIFVKCGSVKLQASSVKFDFRKRALIVLCFVQGVANKRAGVGGSLVRLGNPGVRWGASYGVEKVVRESSRNLDRARVSLG